MVLVNVCICNENRVAERRKLLLADYPTALTCPEPVLLRLQRLCGFRQEGAVYLPDGWQAAEVVQHAVRHSHLVLL